MTNLTQLSWAEMLRQAISSTEPLKANIIETPVMTAIVEPSATEVLNMIKESKKIVDSLK